MSVKKGILERLRDGPVIGDGGFVFALEKRGYVKAGPWTPEVTVEHPEAVRQLHREFLRAGSDVMQALTFYASDDRVETNVKGDQKKYSGKSINQAACNLAKEVAAEGDALVAGGICQTPSYTAGLGKTVVQEEFRKQVQVFVDNGLDFIVCEFFEQIEEIEWAIEVCKERSLPVAATMCISAAGDLNGVSAGDCAVRMARAGADVVGVNCQFDPSHALETVKLMKDALDSNGLKVFLMTQPLAMWVPDCNKHGYVDLPEFPFALEPRVLTRWDMQKYARDAYSLGVRYIGGCCGFEPYHVRALAEELSAERGGRLPAGSEKHAQWGGGLAMHTKPWVRDRAGREYWENLNPSSGRPFSAVLSRPSSRDATAGDNGS